MTDEESQRLYARRERFVDAFMAASLAGRYGLLDDHDGRRALRWAIEAWNSVADTCREPMLAAGLLPFERIKK